MQVLRLAAKGRANKEISSTLFISEHTVARHLQNIFTKLGVSSRTEETAYAFEHSLVYPASGQISPRPDGEDEQGNDAGLILGLYLQAHDGALHERGP